MLLCTGKLYYSLAATREKEGVRDTAILRVEQLYPFPKKELQTLLTKYRAAREYGWVQEEPQNRGAWGFMSDHLRGMLPDPAVLQYFGRDEAASPATGSPKMHEVEEREILAHALDLPARKAEAAKGSNGATARLQRPAAGTGNTRPASGPSRRQSRRRRRGRRRRISEFRTPIRSLRHSCEAHTRASRPGERAGLRASR